jgi:hypothetical protein
MRATGIVDYESWMSSGSPAAVRFEVRCLTGRLTQSTLELVDQLEPAVELDRGRVLDGGLAADSGSGPFDLYRYVYAAASDHALNDGGFGRSMHERYPLSFGHRTLVFGIQARPP